jgi:hypothetical protein
VLLRMPLLLRGSVEISAAARAILQEDGIRPSLRSRAPSSLLGFLVWDQAVRAMETNPSEGPQCIYGVLGQGPSNKSQDVF